MFIYTGLSAAGQVQGGQTKDQSEETHPQPDLRWNTSLPYAHFQLGVAHFVAHCVALGHVWTQRLPWRGQRQSAGSRLWQSPIAVVSATRTCKWAWHIQINIISTIDFFFLSQSEPFDDVATYRGDIVVGLKYIPPENLKSSIFSRGSSLTGSSSNLRKFGGSIKSAASKSDRSAKGGQLHVLVKEAKHLSPIKTNGTCDAFCKRWVDAPEVTSQ